MKSWKKLKPFLKKHQKTVIALLLIGALVGGYGGWLAHENAIINVTVYDVTCTGLPAAFKGYRIAQISDLHNTTFGEGNRQLIDSVRSFHPNIIVLTGDTIDSRHTDVAAALQTAQQLQAIAPLYYVTGNHEQRIPEEAQRLEEGLTEMGAEVLHDRSVIIRRKGRKIRLIGIDDPNYIDPKKNAFDNSKKVAKKIKNLYKGTEFTILLSHRPEIYETYCSTGVDMVLAGHAHGGQVRLPLVGAVYCPSQGWFPRYTEGVIQDGDTTMIVSRGLGQSVVPVRVNNSPELVCIRLHRTEDLSS